MKHHPKMRGSILVGVNKESRVELGTEMLMNLGETERKMKALLSSLETDSEFRLFSFDSPATRSLPPTSFTPDVDSLTTPQAASNTP